MRHRSFAIWIYPLMLCFLAFIGCSSQQDSSGDFLSGVDEQPDACSLIELTESLLDPHPEFHRSKGKPVTETVGFSVPTDGEICIVVSNGLHDPPHGQRISAAWISIDGDLVIGPDPFSQVAAEVTAPHTVTAGDHELSVTLASKPGSFISIDLRFLPADTLGPDIHFTVPSLPDDVSPIFHRIEGGSPGPSVRVAGYVEDMSGISELTFTSPEGTKLISGIRFDEQVFLLEPEISPLAATPVVIKAKDTFGNESTRKLSLISAGLYIPGEVVVRFAPDADRDEILNLLSFYGVSILRSERSINFFVVGVPQGMNPRGFAEALRSHEDIVAYALANVHSSNASCPPPGELPNDEWVPSRLTWYLDNDNLYYSAEKVDCVTQEDCPGPGETCDTENGYCVCIVSTDCISGSNCIYHSGLDLRICGYYGLDGWDIGWLDSIDEVCIADDPSAPSVVAVLESGFPDFEIDELRGHLWTNSVECCGKSSSCPDVDQNGNPECIIGEAIGPDGNPGDPCNNHDECSSQLCIFVPEIKRCFGGYILNGQNCASDDDCIEEFPFPSGECRTLPEFGACSDGCPGLCGFDDDGDGSADDDDIEVKDLKERLCSNHFVDHPSCQGGSCPLAPIDDDGDGFANCGGDGVCKNDPDDDCYIDPSHPNYPGEELLAAWDDDEDGHIDDVHGVLLHIASDLGELFSTTVLERHAETQIRRKHSTWMADIIAGEVNNNLTGAGIHPRGKIMAVGSHTYDTTLRGIRYAASHGALVINYSSYEEIKYRPNGEDEYYNEIKDAKKAWSDFAGPQTLVVASATNARSNLDTEHLLPPDGEGRYKIPHQFNDERVIVVASTNIKDEFADYWTGCAPGKLAESPCGHVSGSASGEDTVLLAAPGDSFIAQSPGPGVAISPVGSGTSWSAAVVSGAIALVIARFPEEFENHPMLALEHLVETQDTGSHFYTLEGRVRKPGRLSLREALNPAVPRPPFHTFEEESFRLGDVQSRNTHDLDFIDKDMDGHIDFLLEIYGGFYKMQEQPRLFAYYPEQDGFRDETLGADGILGGSGVNSDRLPDITGNYIKADIGDIDKDGCADIALAGFVEENVGGDPDKPLRGQKNRILFQTYDPASANPCTGRFYDASNEPVGIGGSDRLPQYNDMTRDIDLVDVDNDGDLDIFVTNANYIYVEGGTMHNRILVNQYVTDEGVVSRIASFIDKSAQWIPLMPIGPPTPDPHQAASDTCDIDHDGDVDIVQAAAGGRNLLFVNQTAQGEHKFYEEGLDRGFSTSSGFSHDVVCHDFTDHTGTGNTDEHPEIIFGRRWVRDPLYLLNNGNGHFSEAVSGNGDRMMPIVSGGTQDVDLCDLDGDGVPEVLFGNGDIVRFTVRSNNVMKRNNVTGFFEPVEDDLGFLFYTVRDLTEEIACGDIDGNGEVDVVVIGNVGQRNWLYRRK